LAFHFVVSLDSSRNGLALRSFFSFCILVTKLKQSITLHLSYKRASCCYLIKKKTCFCCHLYSCQYLMTLDLFVGAMTLRVVCAYSAVFWVLWYIVCTRSCWRNKS
jgi:hypothetical protein